MLDVDFGDYDSEDESLNTSYFLNHMRKCFIATDDNRYCEYLLVPELEIDHQCISRFIIIYFHIMLKYLKMLK